jgi:hypothetical protein
MATITTSISKVKIRIQAGDMVLRAHHDFSVFDVDSARIVLDSPCAGNAVFEEGDHRGQSARQKFASRVTNGCHVL